MDTDNQPSLVRHGEGPAINVIGVRMSFLDDGERAGGAWSALEASVPRDAGPPLHRHGWAEAFYVLEGEVRFTTERGTFVASAGDFVHVPGGAAHGFCGASERPARMLVLDAMARSTAFFREVDRQVVDLPADFAKMPAIAARHGVRFEATTAA